VGRAVRAARSAGFDNVSIDLIYGAPGHSEARVRDDARRAVDLGTDHLSAYALTLEHLAEEVPMARDRALGRIQVPDDDAQAAMGAVVRDELKAAGFSRYEISNYARPGRESRHNLVYWRADGYLALGVGASGFAKAPDGLSGRRYSNKRAPEFYFEDIESGRISEKEAEAVGRDEIFLERLYTGLRLVEGLDLAALDAHLGTNTLGTQAGRIRELVRTGLATFDGRRLALTDAGLDLHTGICASLAG
jgi:oxygen-independent coproporphyrinogen-3 oxidase